MRHIPFNLEHYRGQMQALIAELDGVDTFWQALEFAANAHDDQWRKSGDAYILHPCSVAMIMAKEMDVDYPEILAAALLHDTVEDVDEVTPEVVEEKFGSYVRAIVEGCTKVTHISGDRQTISRRTHRKIFSGAARRLEVMLVKLADRLHNLRTLQAMPKAKQQRIADETLAIYAPLAGALGLFNMKREMYELAIMYKFPRQSGKLHNRIRRLTKAPLGKKVVATLQQAARETGKNCVVDIRTKRLWAYYDIRNRILLQRIETPQEIILLADTPQDCYTILGVLNRTFPPIPRTIRDFIANPKKTGYQGLHARAIIEGQKFFFKIRTEKMQRKAQRGLFQNWTSKKKNQRKFIGEIQEMFDVMGSEESVSYRDIIAASGVKEIYTYTPEGELFQFPYGSTVLDFAFRIHSEVGFTCKGAIIRGRKVPPTHQLRDGDMVRILRTENPLQHSQDMVAYCKTPRARGDLAKSFRERRGSVTTNIGYTIFNKELVHYSLTPQSLDNEKMTALLKRFLSISKNEWDKMDDTAKANAFYRSIGEGRYRLHTVMSEIAQLCDVSPHCLLPPNTFNTIELTTLDPVVIKLSSCCNPNPAQNGNLALLTSGGLSVHRKECSSLINHNPQREDIVQVSWDTTATTIDKPQTYHILSAERKELLSSIADAPYEMKIIELELLSKGDIKRPAWLLRFQVPNLELLQAVQDYFKKFDMEFEFTLEI